MQLKMDFKHSKYSNDELSKSILGILNENKLCSIATVDPDGSSYINTAYFCYDEKLNFYILTDPNSQHCKSIEENDSVAMAIFDSHQSWDDDLRGLQIKGSCKRAKGTKLINGTARYLKRFAGLSEFIKHPDDFAKGALNSRIYIIETNWIKLFDEKSFGEDTYITLDY